MSNKTCSQVTASADPNLWHFGGLALFAFDGAIISMLEFRIEYIFA